MSPLVLLLSLSWAQESPPAEPSERGEPEPSAQEPTEEQSPAPELGPEGSEDPTTATTPLPPPAQESAGWGDEGDDSAGWGDEGDDSAGWGDEGDDSAGFASPVVAAPAEPPAEPSAWSFEGMLRSQEAFGVEQLDEQALVMARQTSELTLRYRSGALQGVGTLHMEVDPVYLAEGVEPSSRRLYGWQVAPRELWIGGALAKGRAELSLGRQRVSWGEGVLLSPVDRVSPRDLRDLGMADLDDLRLPVTMLRAQAFLDRHRAELMLVPEADFGFRSPPEGPFGLIPGLTQRTEIPGVDAQALLAEVDTAWLHLQPRFALEQLQAFGRWSWRGPGVDLALYGASLLDQQGVIVNPEGDPNILDSESIDIPLDHRRYTFLGLSGATVLGSTVLRFEGSADLGRSFNSGELLGTPSFAWDDSLGQTVVSEIGLDAEVVERDVYTGLIGLTWTGLPETRVDLDLTQGYLPEGGDDLLFPVGKTQYGLRLSRTLLRQRLELSSLAAGMGLALEHGLMVSSSARYSFADGVSGTLGYVYYRPGEEIGPLLGFEEHDRLFVQARWDF